MYREDGMLFIIMEYLPGQTLELVWKNLAEHEKVEILAKLRVILNQMHSLPSPGFYGSISKGSVPYDFFWAPGGSQAIRGPFNDETAFNMAVINKSRWNSGYNNTSPFRTDFHEKHLLQILDGHHPTFSHSDVQRKNIIVYQRSSQESETGKEWEVSLVDWASAGWYPDHWEYVASYFAFVWDDDWPSRVDDFLEPHPVEAAIMHVITQELWF
ncbi:MAG: hypothetical protein M4579_007038 [Chaenotheca gracillima]|nr:MAG: hypothetical protein M4579_007038 [Chaenotheca gracillima]